MKVALILPFVLIAVAPLVGRWRANVWLKKNIKSRSTEPVGGSLVETAQVP
jgi:drug/metabolite transporter superfamily protein YnfA